ncbi:MAG: cyd operon YbgE family protein [Candidatus Malihini olakiniferum]
MVLLMSGCVMWDPTRFAACTSALEIWQGPLLV